MLIDTDALLAWPWLIVIQEKSSDGKIVNTVLEWYADPGEADEAAEARVIDAWRARQLDLMFRPDTSVKVFFLRALKQAEITADGVLNPVDEPVVVPDPGDAIELTRDDTEPDDEPTS